jgi:hypothetical protein
LERSYFWSSLTLFRVEDPPHGQEKWVATEGGFANAVDLVKYIRQEHGRLYGVLGFFSVLRLTVHVQLLRAECGRVS